jgi:DNA sulfur modification protein DndB
MKIPAIRARIGNWDYYVTTLNFGQVATMVSEIDDQLHQSEGLKDLIQRSLTDNYLSIKTYILNQPEMFFNSLVLAVYDDYPRWREISFQYDDLETYQMGILEFDGEHKVFPVDGQHRVKGIKAALADNRDLASQSISTIFIGHRNDNDGKKRTRRLFTTLNRYAKPVSESDTIALDEDDVAAILTREMLEEFNLFTGNRVINTRQKAIPNTNRTAITSIITLYQANIELVKYYLFQNEGRKPTAKRLEHFLKFRPAEDVVDICRENVNTFWIAFRDQLEFLQLYLEAGENPADDFRESNDGGNLVFRPIGFLPLVKASVIIKERLNLTFQEVFHRFNEINFFINSRPWTYVLWNPLQHRMVMSNSKLTELMLMYLAFPNILSASELQKLKETYAAAISIENPDEIAHVLDNIV